MTAYRPAPGLVPLLLGLAMAVAGPVVVAPAGKAWAQPKPAAPAAAPAKDKKSAGVPGFGSNSKDPIEIESDKLEVFSKEQRAVYTGNVVAVQGETTIKAPTMIVFYDRQSDKATATATPAASGGDKPGATPAAASPATGSQPAGQDAQGENSGTSLRRVEAKGGVSVVSKDQVATGNEGVFDRSSNKIILTGNVALSQGDNVTKGQKLVYDTETGIAVVESGPGASTPGGRVRGVFTPGSDDKKGKTDQKDQKAKPQKPQG
jgi:lipopolysaccharide export system protein LptA